MSFLQALIEDAREFQTLMAARLQVSNEKLAASMCRDNPRVAEILRNGRDRRPLLERIQK